MPQGPLRQILMPPPVQSGPPVQLDPTPLAQTNPGLARLVDFFGGLTGLKDALVPESSNATVAGAGLGAALPLMGVLGSLKKISQPIRAYHGSPNPSLTSISANPIERQFDNATSRFGAFFTPDMADAKRYADKTGHVYQVDVPLKKPYEMSWDEFGRFQDPTRDANGKPLAFTADAMKARDKELQVEAAALRERLTKAGHDGIIVRDSKGNIKEIASFKDVRVGEGPTPASGPLKSIAQPIKAYHGSPHDFDKFSLSKAGTTTDDGFLGKGLYFSTDQNVAKNQPHQYQADLSVQNPLSIEMQKWGESKKALVTKALGIPENSTADQITAAAKAKGFDSVRLDYSPLGYHHQEIAVFDEPAIQGVKKLAKSKPN